MTEATVNKLEEAFLMGCPDLEACLFAGITKQTLYNYQEKNPAFVDRKEALKQNPFMKARKVQLDDLNDGNSAIAQAVLTRKEGSKLSVGNTDGTPLTLNFFEAKTDGG